ncbi:N-acetylglucosamine-6-phosphate deacetylase [Sinorhizobium alkalisoli]|uniref:N-acetylglucosamine-6-phosphate deacetylase n=1 Tax=Sinorhizobium alkalisoli TaxID=1752398 RepID=A0A1E3VH57_9HYPH|nr:N-acetylglucosamine-6-phosphate deacetylase [Sinorhizobium alkalisoli]MCG5480790.1 N-acetylglucosamine-6-phosphate deacetylase [Sinorhizobium alkalisoli]ODR92905.1 N-acetylglucosamine-6-phosphate deacetylase [Sinorhizobium alkalisoli]QFI70659.1 N-acetylglucosamine-6-phosphate deacetylase [Sinorhizobium alkalisoli]
MKTTLKITGARIFDGNRWHEEVDLVVENGRVASIGPQSVSVEASETVDAKGQLLVPGFIDLQVNGGGGALLNEQPTLEGIQRICQAHAAFGTTAMLPTLITDTRAVTRAAIAAGVAAKAADITGFLGLHLEGPHLSVARKGAHDPSLIRPMDADDLETLLTCMQSIGCLMVTLAPENVSEQQVRTLADAGVIVSLGHTDASFVTACAYAEAGASCVTHLFNAMSGLGHREPGVAGAALAVRSLNVGLIADGFHVDPAVMQIAMRGKQGPGRIFLVTDAMSTIGTDMTRFSLNGREILRENGRLTLADGTLAGADIDMLSCVRYVHQQLDLPLNVALRMASAYPAEAIGLSARKGRLTGGAEADFLLLTGDLTLRSTWINGRKVFEADVSCVA